MPGVFLSGPLGHPSVLQIVLGAGAPEPETTCLEGYRLAVDVSSLMPRLAAAKGGSVEGLLLRDLPERKHR